MERATADTRKLATHLFDPAAFPDVKRTRFTATAADLPTLRIAISPPVGLPQHSIGSTATTIASVVPILRSLRLNQQWRGSEHGGVSTMAVPESVRRRENLKINKPEQTYGWVAWVGS
jgi:hypothetical protein